MGDVKITPDSELGLKGVGSPVNINIKQITGIDPLKIDEVQKISPLAHHIKEVNNIDPILVDAFHVNEIKNIDPITIEKFNVTNLPTLNMVLRQIPSVDLNVRKIPAISIGTHQKFCAPSNYTLRARFLGIELFRLHFNGQTVIKPHELVKREKVREQNKSFPEPVTAGNPAIPIICKETASSTCHVNMHHKHHVKHYSKKHTMPNFINKAHQNHNAKNNKKMANQGLSFGHHEMKFNISGNYPENQQSSGSSVSSGE